MITQLIDDRGRGWSVGDAALKAHLRSSLNNAALAEFAITNMGWIGIRRTPRAIHIKCRPAFVAEPSLVALLFLVHDQPRQTLAIELLSGEPQHFVMRDRATFTRFLASLIAGSKPLRPSAHGKRLLQTKRAEHESPFRRTARIAQRIGSHARSIEDAVEHFRALFNGRWSLYVLDREKGHTVIADIGNTYTPFNPGWLANAKDQSLCGYADEDYGLWVAQMHREALDTGQVAFHDVDAVVSFPQVGDTRLRYTRATIPILRNVGPSYVLSAAISDDAIDLRKSCG